MSYQLLAFDLDDTLAPSKTRIPLPMAATLADLSHHYPIAIITGGTEEQLFTQVINHLPNRTRLEHFHLLPTCGTKYLRHLDGSFHYIYAIELSDQERHTAITALQHEAQALGLWEENPWGNIIEDRGSQITFSALGQSAPLEVKKTWDPSNEKKNALAAAVAKHLPPTLQARSGGSTSVDITMNNMDKAHGMKQLSQLTGIDLKRILFIGDRLDPAGNDYPVKALGVPTYAVADWTETHAFLRELLDTLNQ